MQDYVPSQLCAVDIASGQEDDAWRLVAERCRGHLTDWGTRRLREGLDGKVRTVVVEPFYTCKDYRSLYSSFYSKKFIDRPSYCSRLHFFASERLTVEEVLLEADLYRDTYMGFAVVEPVGERCLGRAILDPAKLGSGNEFCLTASFPVNINGAEYTVRGFPYRAQSKEATVCAQTALWACCRYLSQRYAHYGEVLPHDIVEMTGDGEGRKIPYRGMKYSDYSSILSQFGCYPAIVRPRGNWIPDGPSKWTVDWSADREAFYDFYSYMESGFPVLTSFQGHVVNVVGHTCRDTLLPGAPMENGFVNSFNLVHRLLLVDDNFFPYQQVGFRDDPNAYSHAFAGSTPPHYPCVDSIYSAVVPLPEKAYLPPQRARELSYRWLNTHEVNAILHDTIRQLGFPGSPVVARTFLTSSIAFKRRKLRLAAGLDEGGGDRLSFHPVDICLPHFVWITEIAPLSLYMQGKIIGEVVLDASASYTEPGYIYGRIGNSLLADGRIERFKDGVRVPYPLFTHNLGER